MVDQLLLTPCGLSTTFPKKGGEGKGERKRRGRGGGEGRGTWQEEGEGRGRGRRKEEQEQEQETRTRTRIRTRTRTNSNKNKQQQEQEQELISGSCSTTVILEMLLLGSLISITGPFRTLSSTPDTFERFARKCPGIATPITY